jgi:hypothetical protein
MTPVAEMKRHPGDERRKGKYSGSQLGLLPAFTLLSNDWLCGDSYLDTAARQLRILTGFHATSVVSRRDGPA